MSRQHVFANCVTVFCCMQLMNECINWYQWCRGMGGRSGNCPFPQKKFGMSENCRKIFDLSESCRLKMQNFWTETPPPISGKFRGKLKFWAPTISSVGKLQLPAPPTSLTHDAAAFIRLRHEILRTVTHWCNRNANFSYQTRRNIFVDIDHKGMRIFVT